MQVLTVWYSLSGNTRKLAGVLASELSAERAEVRCPRYNRSIVGALAIGYDLLTGHLPQVEAEAGASFPQTYGLVAVGAPLWAGRAAAPIRTYLKDHKGQFKRLALFLTYAGSSPSRAFQEMEMLAGTAAAAALAVRAGDLAGEDYTLPATFLAALKSEEAGGPP